MENPPIIPPETKDWTVVLTEGCAECGFDAPLPEGVADRLVASIPRWQAVLARPGVAERPEPLVWSPLEYACHVRDVCRIFGERATLMLEQDDPGFANWDQDAAAVEERYHAQDPAAVAGQYGAEAERTAAIFAGVTGEAWQRRGLRSNGSEFTVATLSVYFLHDIEHHLADVAG